MGACGVGTLSSRNAVRQKNSVAESAIKCRSTSAGRPHSRSVERPAQQLQQLPGVQPGWSIRALQQPLGEVALVVVQRDDLLLDPRTRAKASVAVPVSTRCPLPRRPPSPSRGARWPSRRSAPRAGGGRESHRRGSPATAPTPLPAVRPPRPHRRPRRASDT